MEEVKVEPPEVVDYDFWRTKIASSIALTGRAVSSMSDSIQYPQYLTAQIAITYLKGALKEMEEMLAKNNEFIKNQR